MTRKHTPNTAAALGEQLSFKFPFWVDDHDWANDSSANSAIELYRHLSEIDYRNRLSYRDQAKRENRLIVAFLIVFPPLYFLYSHVKFSPLELAFAAWWACLLAVPFLKYASYVSRNRQWPHGEALFEPYFNICRQMSEDSRERYEHWKKVLSETDPDLYMKVRSLEHQQFLEEQALAQNVALSRIAKNSESIARSAHETAQHTRAIRRRVE